MGLVDYSDSDNSDVEATPAIKQGPIPSKPAFQKVVDGSNSNKIRVSLPQAALKEDIKSDEPPTKRARVGGGGFGDFNSFLPAPKRAGQTTNATIGPGKAAKTSVVRAGVSLKTGAAPGFSRDPELEREHGESIDTKENEQISMGGGSGLSLPPPKASLIGDQMPAEEVKLVGKPLMFKPLSVARKPVTKKKQSSATLPAAKSTPAPATPEPKAEKPAQKPKLSLFSMSAEPSSFSVPTSSGPYQSIIHEASDAAEVGDGADDSNINASYEDYTPTTHKTPPPMVPTPPVSQSLNDIAGDLNLSTAERRQLFGRQKGNRSGPAATKIINFNTDQEYLHNEELRAAGEQVVHNPVRALAPGKHSLQQLINAAKNQKDALEESFAQGKSNRAQASSRYGW